MSKRVYITRRVTFNAAHKVYNPEWSDDKNWEVFGKCSNPNWHGHNYTLEVTVAGSPDPMTGFVMNLAELKEILNDYVVDKLDHRNLNLDVDFMKGVQPSTENLAVKIWEQIEPHIKGCDLHSVKIIETENNYVEYKGE